MLDAFNVCPIFCLIPLLTSSCTPQAKNSTANTKTIYGTDDRIEISKASSEWITRSKAVGLVIDSKELKQVSGGYSIKAPPLTAYGVCPEERFANQPILGKGTGFLVGPNIFVTAGHVIRRCDDSAIIFDVSGDIPSGANVDYAVTADRVFFCKEILSSVRMSGVDDYSVIRLDRPAISRIPLKFRETGLPAIGAPLTIIGHPSGLPMKLATGDSNQVRNASLLSNIIIADLDSFAGNSGSPVFDTNTGTVEGILITGGTDYQANSPGGCKKTVFSKVGDGMGEKIMRFPRVIPFIGPALVELGLAREISLTEKLAEANFPTPSKLSVPFESSDPSKLMGLSLTASGTWRGTNCLEIRLLTPNGRLGGASFKNAIIQGTTDTGARAVFSKQLNFNEMDPLPLTPTGKWMIEMYRPDGCMVQVKLSEVELKLFVK